MNKQQIQDVVCGRYEKVRKAFKNKEYDTSLILSGGHFSDLLHNWCDDSVKYYILTAAEWIDDIEKFSCKIKGCEQTIKFLAYQLKFLPQNREMVECIGNEKKLMEFIFDYYWDEREILSTEIQAYKIILGYSTPPKISFFSDLFVN